MAHKTDGQSAAIRFTMPRSLQKFDLFWQLPYDIRHMIWEEVIFTPGIHFLKFVGALDASPMRVFASASASTGAHSGGFPAALPERRAEGRHHSEGLVYSATLEPIFPISYADNSHYITMNKTLARLRTSCNEARLLVDQVLAQPDNVTLNNGQLVMLQRSSDVICIDYPNMTHARSLGEWAERLDLGQLAKVRRLAVRYYHEWDNDLICGYCGRAHSYHGNHPFPKHVYEFAALFKNLETFYFIDYLTVRKPPHAQCPVQAQDGPHERFASGEGGRTYFEVDPKTCTTHTHVFETLKWVQSNYIAHCICNSQGPSRPENVRFKVLACEWESDRKLVTIKYQPTAQTTPIRKKRMKSHASDLTTSSHITPTAFDGSISQPTNASTPPVVFGDEGQSKFDFSLEFPF
ncbi:hypothetical protein GGS21DRAFT_494404 [Xylaria nigripes]|nr:hypothetical protein GGS21DRAFT_494404 [Xylaria nigripes]